MMNAELILKCLLALGAFMIAGCFIPRSWLPQKMPHDSVLHIGTFALLTLGMAVFSTDLGSIIGFSAGLYVFGWLVEVIQMYVPGRSFGWDDLRYNAIGILIGCLLGVTLMRVDILSHLPVTAL